MTSYCLEDGLLHHVEKGTKTRPHTRMQLVVPSAYRKTVLEGAHDGYLGGHLGIEKTTDKVTKSYYWSTLLKDVMQYVQSCEICQRKKLAKERRPMQDMPMPSAPIEIIGIDTCGPFPVSDAGNKYVCTIVDHFSGSSSSSSSSSCLLFSKDKDSRLNNLKTIIAKKNNSRKVRVA